MKKAIQQLIDELKKCIQLHNPSGSKEERMVCGAYTNAIIIAESFIPIEKQQIVDAHISGYLDFEIEGNAVDVAEEYYKTTFNK